MKLTKEVGRPWERLKKAMDDYMKEEKEGELKNEERKHKMVWFTVTFLW